MVRDLILSIASLAKTTWSIKMADTTEYPQVYVAVYRGPEDGADNIKNDPFLKKMDPIEGTIYKTKAMAVAKGEYELLKSQKITKARNMRHALHRIELDLDEGDILRVNDSRAEIRSEICQVSKVSLSIQFGDNASIEQSTELVSYENSPFYFGRQMTFFNKA